MKKNKKEIEYKPGNIKRLVESVAKYAAEHPEKVLEQVKAGDFRELHVTIQTSGQFPGYGNRAECFNCGHHMKIAVYTAGVIEALLVLKMAQSVRDQIRKGVPFTEANRVHVPTLATSDGIRHAITRASYLGLVAQPPKTRNSGYWVITSWGWAALRGDPIARTAKYWRGKLLERSAETTTLGEMFRTHTELVERALARRKAVENDYRADVRLYQPTEWVQYAGPIDDHLAQHATL